MRTRTVAILFAAAAAAVALPESVLLKCPFFHYLAVYCPGCGIQRAIRALWVGDLATALHNNLLILSFPLFLVMLRVTARSLGRERGNIVTVFSTLVVMVAFTVLRNVPGSSLAPF
ncbi:MAG: DUF2752 domain-containing protein [bacterium]|jgi:hypothetical protein|nr:DUF2752 domain-containing protein [Gemmatimonadota bacterium]HIL90261.1 DUF2752 domain-containing protein [Gemmatimonadota bacterium]